MQSVYLNNLKRNKKWLPLVLGAAIFSSASLYAAIGDQTNDGTSIYTYDVGCARFEVFEKIPNIVDGIAMGPATHTLLLTSNQTNAALEDVSVNPDDFTNIMAASTGSAFNEGFINLSKIPKGIRKVVIAEDPTKPFIWHLSAKCHTGAVGVLHFEKIKSTPPHTDVEDKKIDAIFFGDQDNASKPKNTKPSTEAMTAKAPRNEIDSLLAGLSESPSAYSSTQPGSSNMNSFDDSLVAADEERLRNERYQQLASATEAALWEQNSFNKDIRNIASQHLQALLEERRREAERIAAEQERKREKAENSATFWKATSSAFLAASGVNAGMDANQAAKMGMDFYNSVDSPEGRAEFQKSLNEGVYYQPSHPQNDTFNGVSVAQNSGQARTTPSYSQPSTAATTKKDSRCAVNGYVGNERSVYWNGSSLSCGDGSAPRVSGYAYWAGMYCGGDTTGPTDARTCNSDEYNAAERNAASRLPPDMARQYGLDH